MNEASKVQRPYSLKRSRGIMKSVYAWYKSNGKTLSSGVLENLEAQLSSLDQTLLANDRPAASVKARQLETFSSAHCKRSFFSYAWELVLALAFALVVATLVRQMWFEPYEIPTGSMRPTFREQDHLTVTKTAFGINYPLETRHLYFDPDLVQRTSVLIFSGDGLPLSDTDTTFLGVFPYKKRYIKRLIGKPGDAIYFYGGQLYGVDKDGKAIKELSEAPWMRPLEYVPFLNFNGSLVLSGPNTFLLRQMHKSYGKLSATLQGKVRGEVFDGKGWRVDDPLAQAGPHDSIKTYSDIFGIRNYAEARLLTREELSKLSLGISDVGEGVLYLQLHHTPSLSYPSPVDAMQTIDVTGYTTVLPLEQRHLDRLMDHLYTARFVVSDGKARRYSLEGARSEGGGIPMPGVADGTYEFYFGRGEKVLWGGITTALSQDNPMYRREASNVQTLFNHGIEFDLGSAPSARGGRFPHRYAYFRDGDLYLMGTLIVEKDDPVLTAFRAREQERARASTPEVPYVAFRDYGPPLKEDGSYDVSFIRTFGVAVPEGHYLVLGDNHAMSSDSRVFGFVPQNNLQGAPSLIIWPPGDRLGAPPQKPYPFMNLPRAIVWSIVAAILLAWYAYHRWRIRRPIFKKVTSH